MGEPLVNYRRVLVCCWLTFAIDLIATTACAQTSAPLPILMASPIQDDATLHDIHFVGTRHGWAVGDHGVIWNTHDSGQTWQLLASGVDCALNGVCFLTDEIGWVVGGRTIPAANVTEGVILYTDNGGRSWRRLGSKRLPRLRSVQFFNLDEGIVVSESDAEFPTGILTTRDGGKSWQPVPGEAKQGWRAAQFLELDAGVVAGDSGQLTVVGGGALLQPQYDRLDLRSFHDVSVAVDFSGWVVGEGGAVLRTETGGVSWSLPATRLPRELSQFVDFHAVEHRGSRVWIAGSPGGMIWHSRDAGANWEQLETGSSVPIRDLEFVSDEIGAACGDLGKILMTRDGGRTWTAVRGANRRMAMVTFVPRPDRIPLQLLTAESGDLGHRAAVVIPAKSAHYNALQNPNRADRTHEAVIASGANLVDLDWRFPLTKPDNEHAQAALLKEWQTIHEGQIAQVFLGHLVSRIRMWRPSVVVVDGGLRDDATATIIEQAVARAIELSGDPTHFPEHSKFGGLQPWSVRKLYRRLPDNSQSGARYESDRYLARVGKPAWLASAPAGRLLDLPAVPMVETFELLHDRMSVGHQGAAAASVFSGLPLSPGSDARRKLPIWDDEVADQQRIAAQRIRNVRAIAERMMQDSRQSSQMIAQLHELGRGLSEEEAAWQLMEIARRYREQSRWELVEATLVELVGSYPDEPIALEAMIWLFRFWSSTETAWQRNRDVQVGRNNLVIDQNEIRNRIGNALRQAAERPFDRGDIQLTSGSSVNVRTETGQLSERRVVEGEVSSDRMWGVGESTEWRSGAVANWLAQANRMSNLIRDRSPGLQRHPEFLFAEAAMLRGRGAFRGSDEIYRLFLGAGESNRWRQIAAGEHWLLQPLGLPPNEIAVCLRAAAGPPHLDGILGDPCWQTARPLRLSHSSHAQVPPRPSPLIYFAFDPEYLYIAGNVPRIEGMTTATSQHAGRTYDARLDGFDRIRIGLDIDRDYSVWYEFEVDQRGWTRDICWEDRSWNPRYHVASGGDSRSWTFEMAIPLIELTPGPPQAKTVWAVGVNRIAPGHEIQSWNQPPVIPMVPESFGLLQFQSSIRVENDLSR